MSESEIQVLRMPIAGEFFYNNCHNRTQIINEILNEIEIQKRQKTAAGEFFFYSISHSLHTNNESNRKRN